MMRYLIDTDVIIDHLRGEEKAHSFLKQSLLRNTTLYYSVISKAEIYSGVMQGEEEDVAILFRSMSEVPIDGRVAEDAGRYRKIFYSSHGLFCRTPLLPLLPKEQELS